MGMKQTEALTLSLEALEWMEDNEGLSFETEIAAIKEALAEQPAQKQEPVACAAPMACSGADKCVFRTSPPASKPWVGLTDEEIDDIDFANWNEDYQRWNIKRFARSIEAKLEEKNA